MSLCSLLTRQHRGWFISETIGIFKVLDGKFIFFYYFYCVKLFYNSNKKALIYFKENYAKKHFIRSVNKWYWQTFYN